MRLLHRLRLLMGCSARLSTTRARVSQQARGRQRRALPRRSCSIAPASRRARSTDVAGANLRRAVTAFQQANGLPNHGHVDDATWRQLHASGRSAAAARSRTPSRREDVAGPFTPDIPADLMEQAQAQGAGVPNAARSDRRKVPREPGAAASAQSRRRPSSARASRSWSRTSTLSMLPRPTASQLGPSQRSASLGNWRTRTPLPDIAIYVTKATSALTVEDASGKVLFHAPVTSGSEHDPLPIGSWKVTTVQRRCRRSTTTRTCSGTPTRRTAKALIPAGTEQSGRHRLDRPVEGALRHPRHARAVPDRPHAVARLRAPDELGRAAGRPVGAAGYAGRLPMRRFERRRAERIRRSVATSSV